MIDGSVHPAGALALIRDYEAGLDTSSRRAGGVHYTPPGLANLIAELAIDAATSSLGHLPRSICDPTCGAGALLVACADALVARGADPAAVLGRLHGGDRDGAAVQVAHDALQRWAEAHGVGDTAHRAPPRLHVGDTSTMGAQEWPGRPSGGFEAVVGNPPFLSQLSRSTARGVAEREAVQRRYGSVGAYADTAALFLLGSISLVGDGGVVAMVQPQSFLAARDTAAVREALLAQAQLRTLWASDELLFDAAVHVCVPVLERRPHGADRTPVEVRWRGGGGDDDDDGDAAPPRRAPAPAGDGSWGVLLAGHLGLPAVAPHGGRRLGELATATAGFRDEFYALCAAAHEAGSAAETDAPRLVTVGMIAPGRCTWGEQTRRLAGRSVLAPVLDVATLERDAPKVARWAAARRVPKVLVATQTRIVEAAADPEGRVVPVTPTISVEARPDCEVDVWWLTAALLAPPVSATALAVHLGAGRSPGALRWSARQVLEVEVPLHRDLWREGAALVRELTTVPADERGGLLRRVGQVLCAAHGVEDAELLEWWFERALRASS
jgi:hypothetical protein